MICDKTFFTLTDSGAPDTTPPIITLQGSNPVTITLDSSYSDSGASAVDFVDGVVSVNINASAVNTSQVGSYSVVFTASDSSGNTISLTRTVVVTSGNSGILLSPSIISPMGPITAINGIVTQSWNSVPGATSYDLTGYEVTSSGSVNYSNILFERLITSSAAGCSIGGICSTTQNITVAGGAWKIRSNSDTQRSDYSDRAYFTVLNSSSRNAVSSRITLKGASSVNVILNSTYIDAGASAMDDSGSIVNVNVDTSAVDTSKVGSYKVTFTTSDLPGEPSPNGEGIETRTVNVVDTRTNSNGGGSIFYLLIPLLLIFLQRKLSLTSKIQEN